MKMEQSMKRLLEAAHKLFRAGTAVRKFPDGDPDQEAFCTALDAFEEAWESSGSKDDTVSEADEPIRRTKWRA